MVRAASSPLPELRKTVLLPLRAAYSAPQSVSSGAAGREVSVV